MVLAQDSVSEYALLWKHTDLSFLDNIYIFQCTDSRLHDQSGHKFLRNLAPHMSNEESMMQHTCTGKSICGLLVDQLILSQSTVGGNIL
jgi:hypothetical protein